ncbi:hypothetical protein [Halostella litorea]|uniref:hypothetical protein n=1 Tax=Halostella litorea TaxID=2528831 RepID=UPI001091EF4B|nr:hypothetical protein [Halostella litorea]
MMVSAAFGELTEVLERLESSDAAVRDVDIGEGVAADGDELTASLTVGVPVIDGAELPDGVTVEGEGVDLRDGRVTVGLTVTLPTDGAATPAGSTRHGGSPGRAESDGVPAYRDPEALRAAYEACDSFPEMTEALGVDVTSETVRRYTVEHDIHDPSESGPPVGPDVTVEASADAADDGDDEPADGSPHRDGGPEEPAGSSDRDDATVAELLAASGGGDGGDALVADGLGVPKGLTVAELAAVVNESDTVYEVTQRLGVDRDQARRLLAETSLLDLVTQRLGAERISVTPSEVRRRIDRGGSGSTR